MDFNLPKELVDYLARLDAFIDAEIKPLQAQDDNERFFDHRREWARTDFDNGGLPRPEWEALLREAKSRADKAGFWRFSLPKEYGGQDGGNLWMSVIRDHLASQGLGLFNDLQNEHSIVGNFPFIVMLRDFGSPAQKEKFIKGSLEFKVRVTFGLTEPNHGSDATHMETRAVRETRNGVVRLAHRRREDVDHRHARGHALLGVRAHQRQGRRREGHHRVPGADRNPGREDRRVPVDLQHADRPPARRASPTSGCPTTRSSAAKATAWRWRRPSCTRTASGRRPARWARRPSASTRA